MDYSKTLERILRGLQDKLPQQQQTQQTQQDSKPETLFDPPAPSRSSNPDDLFGSLLSLGHGASTSGSSVPSPSASGSS